MAEAIMSESQWLAESNEDPLFTGASADRDYATVRRAACKVRRNGCLSYHDVDDLTQETAMNIAKYDKFEPGRRACLFGFAKLTALRIAIRWSEQARRMPVILTDIDLDLVLRDTIGEEAYDAKFIRDIERYLSAAEQDTLRSSVVGETYAEMAKRLGLAASTVRARRFRMLERAKEVVRNRRLMYDR